MQHLKEKKSKIRRRKETQEAKKENTPVYVGDPRIRWGSSLLLVPPALILFRLCPIATPAPWLAAARDVATAARPLLGGVGARIPGVMIAAVL